MEIRSLKGLHMIPAIIFGVFGGIIGYQIFKKNSEKGILALISVLIGILAGLLVSLGIGTLFPASWVLDKTREIVKIQLSDTSPPTYVIKGKTEGIGREFYSCLIKTDPGIGLNQYEVDQAEIIQEKRQDGQVSTFHYRATNIFGGILFGVKPTDVKYEIRIPEGGLTLSSS